METQIKVVSCCKFCIYTLVPPKFKNYNMTVDIHKSRSEDFDFEWQEAGPLML